jgi:hypothetical protein
MSDKKNRLTKSRVEKTFEDQVELFAMGLSSCSCSLDRPNYIRMRDAGSNNELRSISSKTNLEDHGESFFDGNVTYELIASDKKNGTSPLKIQCTFQAHFHGPRSIVPRDANRFLRTYFRVVSWPYFRQFVSDITSRMFIAPLVLPLLPEPDEE